jgi:hypothetical protein
VGEEWLEEQLTELLGLPGFDDEGLDWVREALWIPVVLGGTEGSRVRIQLPGRSISKGEPPAAVIAVSLISTRPFRAASGHGDSKRESRHTKGRIEMRASPFLRRNSARRLRSGPYVAPLLTGSPNGAGFRNGARRG